jgi:DNA repair protein RadA/Sms
MAKEKSLYECESCGYQSTKWMGQCPSCKEWNSLIDVTRFSGQIKKSSTDQQKKPVKLSNVDSTVNNRFHSGVVEFDRVLGGGITEGSLTLIGGEPGIGKSTLILEVCRSLLVLNKDFKILYVSGEESEAQIAARARRMKIEAGELFLINETCWEVIKDHASHYKPDLLIIDSIQTTTSLEVQSNSGTSTQIKEITYDLMSLCKQKGLTAFVIGHVTKEGSIAGPKMLEHMVDTVIYFEGDQIGMYRLLRSIKNRFGNTNEVGIFEMTSHGLNQVENPSNYFIEDVDQDSYGRALTCIMEGTRSLFVEIQSLVVENKYGNGRRTGQGLDNNRLALLLAVIEKYFNIPLSCYDVYVNVVGGLRLNSRDSDLAIIISILSSYKKKAIGFNQVYVGEVGLAGEIRNVPFIEKRVSDAIQMGYSEIICSERDAQKLKEVKGIGVIGHRKAIELKI